MSDKPFSQACENNKDPILERLRDVFTEPGVILEIGTGTGQHAVHFARALPHLVWVPSDQPGAEEFCKPWLEEAGLENVQAPLALDVAAEPWPLDTLDGAFTANTAHIMSWAEVEAMFHGLGKRLRAGGAFCHYGPFNYDGLFTSDSNRQFDQYLRRRSGHMGIRDLGDLERLAGSADMALESDHAMPANNRFLVWRKQ